MYGIKKCIPLVICGNFNGRELEYTAWPWFIKLLQRVGHWSYFKALHLQTFQTAKNTQRTRKKTISAGTVVSDKFSTRRGGERMIPRENKKISQLDCGFDNHMGFADCLLWNTWPQWDPQNHRITECFGLEGMLKRHLLQHPCNEQGHLQLDQVAQSPVQPGLECFQGWSIYHLSGQPVTVLHHPHCKNILPYI